MEKRVIYLTFGIFSIVLFLILFIPFKNDVKRINWKRILLFLIIEISASFLLYKMDTYPNIFFDEANGFYDAKSIALYGFDSNLHRFPVYLQSFMGQGQSVLLVYMSQIWFKLFGISLFSFRYSLVITSLLSILMMTLVLNKYYKKYLFGISIAVSTAPYLLTEARYAMDCNISIWVLLAGISLFFASIKAKKNRYLLFLLSFLIIGACAYAYNVSWMYLPLLVFGLVFIILKHRLFTISRVAISMLLLTIEEIPILIFAISSNIQFLNYDKKILFFSVPKLAHSRVNDSVISLHGHLVRTMLLNLIGGIKQLFIFNDNLSWNSLPNFGAYYLFSIVFFIFGLSYLLKHHDKVTAQVTLCLLMSNILCWLVVKPNYNHWMFTHLPVLVIIGVGIQRSLTLVNWKYVYGIYLVSLALFIQSYFNQNRYTGFNIQTISNVRKIRNITKGQTIYFYSQDNSFLWNIRDFDEITPSQYQEARKCPYSESDYGLGNSLRNYVKLSNNQLIKKNSYILIPTNQKIANSISSKRVISQIIINNTYYNLYRVRRNCTF